MDVKDAYFFSFSHLPTGEKDARRCIKDWRREVLHIQTDVRYIATVGNGRSEKHRVEFLAAAPEQHLCR